MLWLNLGAYSSLIDLLPAPHNLFACVLRYLHTYASLYVATMHTTHLMYYNWPVA